jgi:hypothetical protein
MLRANCRMSVSLRSGVSVRGSAIIPDLPPPWGIPARAFFQVIARARRKTSRVLTVGVIRIPPIAGPMLLLSMTTIPRKPQRGS